MYQLHHKSITVQQLLQYKTSLCCIQNHLHVSASSQVHHCPATSSIQDKPLVVFRTIFMYQLHHKSITVQQPLQYKTRLCCIQNHLHVSCTKMATKIKCSTVGQLHFRNCISAMHSSAWSQRNSRKQISQLKIT